MKGKQILGFARNAGFTKNETIVILFLSGSILLGTAVRFFSSSPVHANYSELYRVHDSLFEIRSNAMPVNIPVSVQEESASIKKESVRNRKTLPSGKQI